VVKEAMSEMMNWCVRNEMKVMGTGWRKEAGIVYS